MITQRVHDLFSQLEVESLTKKIVFFSVHLINFVTDPSAVENYSVVCIHPSSITSTKVQYSQHNIDALWKRLKSVRDMRLFFRNREYSMNIP